MKALWPLFLTLLSQVIAVGAHATTAAERDAMQKAAPHLALGQGKSLRVNWARQLNFMGGEKKAKELAQELRKDYESCVEGLRPPEKAKPVREWPDYPHLVVTDSYVSGFAQVQYATSTMYLLSSSADWTCELKEHVVHTAEVRSPLGQCKVKMSEGTATGVCNAFHDHVKKEMARGGKGSSAPNPGVHPMSGLQVTDERRDVAGLPCRVIHHAVGGLKTCMAQSTSFAGYQGNYAVPLGGYTALMLSQDRPGIDVLLRAIDGKMDFQAGSNLLFPFRAAGIKVTEGRPVSRSWYSDDEP